MAAPTLGSNRFGLTANPTVAPTSSPLLVCFLEQDELWDYLRLNQARTENRLTREMQEYGLVLQNRARARRAEAMNNFIPIQSTGLNLQQQQGFQSQEWLGGNYSPQYQPQLLGGQQQYPMLQQPQQGDLQQAFDTPPAMASAEQYQVPQQASQQPNGGNY